MSYTLSIWSWHIETMLKAVDYHKLRDYFRQLGLTSVLGSMTGFFLRPHHDIIPVITLFSIGCVASYYGLRKGNQND